jgi:predicted metal-dependent phosphotriesterase family hydrolase
MLTQNHGPLKGIIYRMAGIETVRGKVESSRLGVTLMHEHIFELDTEISSSGVTDAPLSIMLVETPRRIFDPSYGML